MGTYTPKPILLPSGIDEVALDHSLVRLPEESLIDFKRRLLLDHRDPVDNSFNSFKKSPTRMVGRPEIPIAKLTLNTTFERPRLKVTATKLYWWEDYNEDPTLEIDIYSRYGYYFIFQVLAIIGMFGTIDTTILTDLEYDELLSKQLRVFDTHVQTSTLLTENYVTNLGHGLIQNLRFTDTTVFRTEKLAPDDLSESGDFYVDYENGVLFSYDLQRGYVNYTYADFPCILWWQPVRVFELNDPDANIIIKDTVTTDAGDENLLLNWTGAAYVNELLNVHPLEWGS